MFKHFVFNCCTVPEDCGTFKTWALAVEHRLLWMDLWRLYLVLNHKPMKRPPGYPLCRGGWKLGYKRKFSLPQFASPPLPWWMEIWIQKEILPPPVCVSQVFFLTSTEKSGCYQMLSCRHKGHCHLSQRNCDDPRIPSAKSALLSLPPWKRNGGGIRSSPDAATSPSFCRMKLCPTTQGLRVLVFIGGRKLSKGCDSDPFLHLWRNCHPCWGEPWVTKLFESYLHFCKWSLAPARMSKCIEITESPA